MSDRRTVILLAIAWATCVILAVTVVVLGKYGDKFFLALLCLVPGYLLTRFVRNLPRTRNPREAR